MRNLIILICIGILLYVAKNWYDKTPKKQAKETLWRYGLYFLAGVLIVLTIMGKVPWLYALVGAMLPLLQRIWFAKNLYETWRQSKHKRSSNTGPSALECEFLRLEINQLSGELEGWILKGERKGQRLSQLDLTELSALQREFSTDADSLRLLHAYLDRRFGSQWHDRRQYHAGRAGGTQMSIEEAYNVLGLKPGADLAAVKKAHKQLIQKFHPDRGGTDYLAAKINEAKNVLRHVLKDEGVS